MHNVDRLSLRLTKRDRPLIDIASEPGFQRTAERARACHALVVGGAGSIGRAVVEALCALRPTALHVVDIDENGLTDLVRSLRSGDHVVPPAFRTSVVALGSSGFERLVAETGPFDIVFNLAAMKHVRSERDTYSLQRMIDTNVRAVLDLTRLARAGHIGKVFSVSSDKAVNPHNLMGATKRWMEKIITVAGGTSARFANVAFSKGSLPHAILQRIDLGEPVAAPSDVSRFFITYREAAHLCLLAGYDGAGGDVLVPRLDPARHATSMVEVVETILNARGYAVRPCADAAEAKALAASRPRNANWWPCVFSPADTSGEKDMEELWYPDEAVDDGRYDNLIVVRQKMPDRQQLAQAIALFEAACADRVWVKAAFINAVRRAVPELTHVDTGASLDERM